MVIIELKYCPIADKKQHIQHTARIFGMALSEVVDK
jgi:hypothetical protein